MYFVAPNRKKAGEAARSMTVKGALAAVPFFSVTSTSPVVESSEVSMLT
jgi:hypothetical protein